MYDYIIITHIPAFYKVNLYNELAKRLNILVVFIASNTAEKRSDDFITLEKVKFEHKVLFDGNFQERNIKDNIKKLKEILKSIQYKKLLVSGWDLKEFWYLVMTNFKSKNCLVLESTINESRVNGIRGIIKKIFLSRISTVFASGILHRKLLEVLRYKGQINITKGVGIINKVEFSKQQREYKKRFLFVGRLSQEKNIELLVEIFNNSEDYTLTIIGTGPLEEKLKMKSKSNITFIGHIDNKNLKKYFLTNDIFILPSIAEPWGLVVEEALYFGMPIIVSKNCGASELIKDGINGYVISIENSKNIKDKILKIDGLLYQKLLYGINQFSVDEKDEIQIKSFEV